MIIEMILVSKVQIDFKSPPGIIQQTIINSEKLIDEDENEEFDEEEYIRGGNINDDEDVEEYEEDE
jgi:hypothetical protein